MAQGVPATAAYQIHKRPFTEEFLRERTQDQYVAAAWWRKLTGEGLVTSDGRLAKDGVELHGKELLHAMKALFPASREEAVAVKEMVELAEAFHMITSKVRVVCLAGRQLMQSQHWLNCFRWFECVEDL